MDTTITITVNIATADKYEGNAEFSLSIDERYLPYLSEAALSNELGKLIGEARKEYESKNSK